MQAPVGRSCKFSILTFPILSSSVNASEVTPLVVILRSLTVIPRELPPPNRSRHFALAPEQVIFEASRPWPKMLEPSPASVTPGEALVGKLFGGIIRLTARGIATVVVLVGNKPMSPR